MKTHPICYIIFLLLTILTYPAVALDRPRHLKHANRYIDITIRFKEAKPNDTLTFVIEDIIRGAPLLYDQGRYNSVQKNDVYKFHVSVTDSCGYFDIIKNRTFTKVFDTKMVVLESYFWEAGDNVFIELSNKESYGGIYTKCKFTGIGSKKYSLRQATDSISNSEIDKTHRLVFDKNYTYFDVQLNRFQHALHFLEQNKDGLSSLSYQVLKSNIIYGGSKRFKSVLEFYKRNIKPLPPEQKSIFKQKYNEQFFDNNPYNFGESVLLNSKSYLVYTYSKFQAQSLVNSDTINQKNVFSLLVRNLSNGIRDKEIAILFSHSSKSADIDELYYQADNIVQDKASRDILNQLIKVGPGREFFNFSLENTKGKAIHFSDFKGRIVLIDFWFNGCGACAAYYKNILAKIEGDNKQNDEVVFVSINIDNFKERWLEGISSRKYTSEGHNVVNLFTNGEGTNHLVFKSLGISMYPFIILVDKTGIIKYLNSTELYEYSSLKKAIASLN